MNVPVTTGTTGVIMSPYLNFNPAYLGPNAADSQFIFPEGAARTRGRLELYFSQICGSVFLGAAVGGVNGFYRGGPGCTGKTVGWGQ
ncbi:mitochondrial import inner membrane translocase subunit Tim23 [Biomphalaria glabrata]|nr:mitochondrial import inner membrane translocase subunit Tim23 [Biomphalaria glabrata]